MPWYVTLTQKIGGGPLTAVVQFFASDQAYFTATNSTAAPPGGYPTRKAAQAVADKYNKQPASKKTVTQPANIPEGSTQGVGFSLPDPVAGLVGVLKAFYDQLTKASMWKSLAWIVLGAAFLIVGLLLWVGPSAVRMSPLGSLARGASGR